MRILHNILKCISVVVSDILVSSKRAGHSDNKRNRVILINGAAIVEAQAAEMSEQTVPIYSYKSMLSIDVP